MHKMIAPPNNAQTAISSNNNKTLFIPEPTIEKLKLYADIYSSYINPGEDRYKWIIMHNGNVIVSKINP